MFVPCPHCGFLVALIVSKGGPPQQCPRCEGVLPGGTDEPGGVGTEAGLMTAVADSGDAPGLDPLAAVVASAAADVPATNAGDAPAKPPSARPAPRGRRGKPGTPSFARPSVSVMPSGPRWPGLLAIGVLLLVLISQLLLAQRHELAADARGRPVIVAACGVLHCDVPPWREPAAFTMLNRSVQPHPRTPGVLAVQASFRNDARWPQPWPTLLLSLADVDGRMVGHGEFQPRQYRGTAGPPHELAPGQSASIQFQVIEPAPRIVAFTFDFR